MFQEAAVMDNNKEKVKLNDDLLDNVAGGYGMQGAVFSQKNLTTHNYARKFQVSQPYEIVFR